MSSADLTSTEGQGAEPTALPEETRPEIRTLTTVLLDRLMFMRQAGISFKGARDLYEILGYDRVLTYRHFRSRYTRGGIAKRLVEAFPKATWRGGVELFEDEDPSTMTNFESAWDTLQTRLKIWTTLQRADILAGLSTYSVLLIGAPGDLSEELPKGRGPQDLLYLSPFAGGGGPGGDRLSRPMAMDADASIMEFETDTSSPRFGLPKTYQLKRTDINSPMLQRPVHWTRIIHIAEGALNDEVYGMPTLESVWNLLDDLDKVTGGGAEAFWLRANQGMHLDVDKDMALPAAKDSVDRLKEQAEDYQHGITRWLRTRGVTVTPLGSQTANFKDPADAIITQIAGSKGIPKRILIGSEMGQLASGQDADNWNTQVMDRRTSYAGPFILRQLVDRLISYNYLPTPKQYDIEWPVIEDLTETEKAAGAKAWAEVNRTAGFTVFTGDEMREKWYKLKPADDDVTDAYKAEGAAKMAMVDKTMGVTVFTPDEIRKTWYGWAPLPPDEAVPIGAPEKIQVNKPPAISGDPNAVSEDAASVILPPVKPTIGNPNPVKAPAAPTAAVPAVPAVPVAPLNPALHGPTFGAPRAASDSELLKVLAAAIEANNTTVIDAILGTRHTDGNE